LSNGTTTIAQERCESPSCPYCALRGSRCDKTLRLPNGKDLTLPGCYSGLLTRRSYRPVEGCENYQAAAKGGRDRAKSGPAPERRG